MREYVIDWFSLERKIIQTMYHSKSITKYYDVINKVPVGEPWALREKLLNFDL